MLVKTRISVLFQVHIIPGAHTNFYLVNKRTPSLGANGNGFYSDIFYGRHHDVLGIN